MVGGLYEMDNELFSGTWSRDNEKWRIPFLKITSAFDKKKIKNASPKFQSNSQIKIFLNKIRNVSMTHFKEFLAVYSTKKPKYRLGDNIPNALSRYTK